MVDVAPDTDASLSMPIGQMPPMVEKIPPLEAVDGVAIVEPIIIRKPPGNAKKLQEALLMARSEVIADQYHTDDLQSAVAVLDGEPKELILRVLKKRSQGKMLRTSHTSRLARDK